jgi:hypothetical protein
MAQYLFQLTVFGVMSSSFCRCCYSRLLSWHDSLALVPCSVLAFLNFLSSPVSHPEITQGRPTVCSVRLVQCFPSSNLNRMSVYSLSKHPFSGRFCGPTYLRLLVRDQLFPYSPSLYGKAFVHPNFGTGSLLRILWLSDLAVVLHHFGYSLTYPVKIGSKGIRPFFSFRIFLVYESL